MYVGVGSEMVSACTVYSIKTETFYGRSTSTGTGVQIYAYGRTS